MAQVLNTNVIGPALLTKALYEPLKAASKPAAGAHAKVVAIGAGVGSVGTNAAGGWYSYRLSKTALNQLVRNLAIEVRRVRRRRSSRAEERGAAHQEESRASRAASARRAGRTTSHDACRRAHLAELQPNLATFSNNLAVLSIDQGHAHARACLLALSAGRKVFRDNFVMTRRIRIVALNVCPQVRKSFCDHFIMTWRIRTVALNVYPQVGKSCVIISS
jgi:hypothetical protein